MVFYPNCTHPILRLSSFEDYFFDLDGTLLETGPSIIAALSATLDAFGIEHEKVDLQSFVGPPLKPMVEKTFLLSSEKSTEFVDAFRKNYLSDNVFLRCSPYQGVVSTLVSLNRNGKKLFVASSKPHHIMLKMLDFFGMVSLFQDIQGSDEKQMLVTKQQVINELIFRNSLQTKDVLMIGDTSSDILGARKSGVHSCGVLYGYGTKDELVNNGADFVISEFSDLID